MTKSIMPKHLSVPHRVKALGARLSLLPSSLSLLQDTGRFQTVHELLTKVMFLVGLVAHLNDHGLRV